VAAAFTLTDLVTRWTPDAVTLVGLAAGAAGYLAGVRALARRGDPWPAGRSLAWAGGLLVVLVATQSGLGTYDDSVFSVHMVQHMLLAMVAPLPLALGAPVTLALRTLPVRRRTLLLRLLHSRLSRVLTHPVLVTSLFAGSTFALYLSGIYPYSLDHAWAHDLVHLHFLVTGCLFAWVVVGIDPMPGRPAYGIRVLMLLAVLPFHAFLGVTLLSQNTLIAGSHYLTVGALPAAELFGDQQTGAGLLWASGEFVGVVLLFAVMAQWMRSEERLAVRTDRHLDRSERVAVAAGRVEAAAAREREEEAELAAYNARLAALRSGSAR